MVSLDLKKHEQVNWLAKASLTKPFMFFVIINNENKSK
jgi:hypothetical protein